MSTITTKDGTEIYYKEWGAGQPVVFSHGWPLTADSWEAQMFFLAANGYRCIAHDRRGHGRSSQPSEGNEMNTYADDLATVIEQLDLQGAVLIGFSTGGGEVARYIGRHGTKRIAKAVARRRDFSARGSLCPVCRREFRECPHTLAQAYDKLDQDVFNARLQRAQESRKESP